MGSRTRLIIYTLFYLIILICKAYFEHILSKIENSFLTS